MAYCAIVVEDELSQTVLAKSIAFSTPDLEITQSRVCNGFGHMKKNIRAYNHAAKHLPFIVLTDLDNAACAPALVGNWLGTTPRHQKLLLRVAVREVEAWVMAHRVPFAAFLGISAKSVPKNPESLHNPKKALIQLARASRYKSIKSAVLPIGTATQGPDYNRCLNNFVDQDWDPGQALLVAPSLRRTILRIQELVVN